MIWRIEIRTTQPEEAIISAELMSDASRLGSNVVFPSVIDSDVIEFCKELRSACRVAPRTINLKVDPASATKEIVGHVIEPAHFLEPENQGGYFDTGGLSEQLHLSELPPTGHLAYVAGIPILSSVLYDSLQCSEVAGLTRNLLVRGKPSSSWICFSPSNCLKRLSLLSLLSPNTSPSGEIYIPRLGTWLGSSLNKDDFGIDQIGYGPSGCRHPWLVSGKLKQHLETLEAPPEFAPIFDFEGDIANRVTEILGLLIGQEHLRENRIV